MRIDFLATLVDGLDEDEWAKLRVPTPVRVILATVLPVRLSRRCRRPEGP
jgi:hypothetical protein